MTNRATGRIMPQPGERWRLRWRQSEDPNDAYPCGHTKADERGLLKGKQHKYNGVVFLVVEGSPIMVCPICHASGPTPEGYVAIMVPDWRLRHRGMIAALVPYTCLEPENWRSGIRNERELHSRARLPKDRH